MKNDVKEGIELGLVSQKVVAILDTQSLVSDFLVVFQWV